MSRCERRRGLEVHHIRKDGGNDLSNATVLCQQCHEKTSSYGTPGVVPKPFSEEIKQKALERAGHQCECTSNKGCH